MQDGIYAKFNTSKGEILIKLTHDKTPGMCRQLYGIGRGAMEGVIRANLTMMA
ncbi:MAG: hypothetical protein R2819_02735 [Allomuricauda sp.]